MRKILAELIDKKSSPFFLCKSKSDGDAKKFCFCFWSADCRGLKVKQERIIPHHIMQPPQLFYQKNLDFFFNLFNQEFGFIGLARLIVIK